MGEGSEKHCNMGWGKLFWLAQLCLEIQQYAMSSH